MSSQGKAAKSPVLAAIGISLAIGLSALISTAEPGTVEEIVTGRVLTRPFTDMQQAHTVAIAALEGNVSHIGSEIDFLSKRVRGSIRRSEEQTFDRFAQMDAELAELKQQIAAVQGTRGPRVAEAPSNDVIGLRSSLNEFVTAHNGAVSALTKRLDKIEVTLGLSTDMTSSIGSKAAKKAAAAAKAKKATAAPVESEATPAPTPTRPEHGHLFNVKPISQQGAPLRISGLRG